MHASINKETIEILTKLNDITIDGEKIPLFISVNGYGYLVYRLEFNGFFVSIFHAENSIMLGDNNHRIHRYYERIEQVIVYLNYMIDPINLMNSAISFNESFVTPDAWFGLVVAQKGQSNE